MVSFRSGFAVVSFRSGFAVVSFRSGFAVVSFRSGFVSQWFRFAKYSKPVKVKLIKILPGSVEKFTLQYEEEMDKSFSRISFH